MSGVLTVVLAAVPSPEALDVNTYRTPGVKNRE